ncbi:MAG: prolyl oligopeptidase family serine peptidase [Phycisphaeraceae bacterium]
MSAADDVKAVSTEPEARTFSPKDQPDEVLHYRYLAPPQVKKGGKFPLLLCLHGAGERGDDNAKQVGHFKPLFASAQTREKYPCYIVLPQAPEKELWATYGWSTPRDTMEGKPSRSLALAKALVEELIKTEAVDPARIYITGLSMGGYGTWEMIQRYPHFFAAAAPVCGGGDLTQAKALTHLPIWAFHGDKDTVITPEKTGNMIDAIKAASKDSKAKWTLYPGVGHNSWSKAFSDPELLEWMFTQKRTKK